MDGFNEKQLEQLAELLATKEDLQKVKGDLQEVKEDVKKLQTQQDQLLNITEKIASRLDNKDIEDTVTKQHVTENRQVLQAVADKVGVVTNF